MKIRLNRMNTNVISALEISLRSIYFKHIINRLLTLVFY